MCFKTILKLVFFRKSKRPVTRDVEDRLYSKLAYLVTKVNTIRTHGCQLGDNRVLIYKVIFFRVLRDLVDFFHWF
jgi:hypothetical protein